MPYVLEFPQVQGPSLYRYALQGPDAARQPFYLPADTRPAEVGDKRNATIDQSPYEQVPFPVGDNTRKIGELVLNGTVDRFVLEVLTEDAVALYVAQLREAVEGAVKIQRGQTRTRALFPTGDVVFRPVSMFNWPFTITLRPSEPDWLETLTQRRVPF